MSLTALLAAATLASAPALPEPAPSGPRFPGTELAQQGDFYDDYRYNRRISGDPLRNDPKSWRYDRDFETPETRRQRREIERERDADRLRYRRDDAAERIGRSLLNDLLD